MRFITIFISILFSFQSFSQGIEFFHGTWAEALEEAKKQQKVIFVDAYAQWCGPCKRMAKNVFTHEKVGEFYNANFINMKLDMEKGEGLKFRQNYPVSAFPTLFYIDGTGEVVHKQKGAQQVEGFLKLGNMVLGKVDYSKDFAAEYEKGTRDPEFMYKYVKALNKSKKPSLKISNEYLRTQKDLTTDFNLRFIHEAAVEADSRIFNLMIENQKEIGMLVGLEAINNKVKVACENTLAKAIEYEMPELLDEAKSKMKAHYVGNAEPFVIKADLEYFKAMEDHKSYMKACDSYAKKVVKGNAKDLNKLAVEIEKHFGGDEKCMKIAEKYAKEAAEKGNHYAYFLTYAYILNENGKKSEALKAAKKSKNLVKEGDRGATMAVDKFIRKIES